MFRGRLQGCGTAAALGLMLVGGPAVASSGAATLASGSRAGASARHALITRAELGRGWDRSAPAPRPVPPITCAQFNPPVLGARQVAAAGTPAYQHGSGGPFVSQSAYSYATPGQARRVARADMRRGLLRCLAASLTQQSTASVTFTVKRRQVLPRPSASVKSAAYRVRGKASQVGQTMDVYLDAILLQRGDTITEFSIATFLEPPGRALERRFTRLATDRLPA